MGQVHCFPAWIGSDREHVVDKWCHLYGKKDDALRRWASDTVGGK